MDMSQPAVAPAADHLIAPDGSAGEDPPPSPTTTAAHDVSMSDELRRSITRGWAPQIEMPHPARPDGAIWTARRRAALSSAFPGRLVVVPAGRMRTRANDTEYAFRADSSFTWLTGETAADAVLVLAPREGGDMTPPCTSASTSGRATSATSPTATTV